MPVLSGIMVIKFPYSSLKVCFLEVIFCKSILLIIAENNLYVVFVEVKSRSADYAVHPAEAVNVPKQRTIINAASNYIDTYGVYKEARFDIITVIITGSSHEIDHIESAYYPTM